MSSTIWVFGDSFSKHFKPSKYFNHLEDTWIERTARTLNHDVVSNSKPLLTLEHMYFNFNKVKNDIKENDVIIITVTNLDRRWYWKNKPLKLLYLNEEEKEAILLNKELHDHYDIYFENFLYNLNHFSKKNNIHTIVLPSFQDGEELINSIKHNYDTLHFGNFSLGNLSRLELIEESVVTELKEDTRVNHLCRDNHIILSNKIINNILHKIPIDLTKGFRETFFDDNIPKDQLFDNIMSRLMRIKINNP